MPLEILNCLGLLDHLKQFKSLHQPEYEMRHYNDHKHILTELEPVINEINEIEQLVIYLKKAANNEAIIVTLGDCAESILDSHECIVRNIDAYKNVQRCIEKITKKPVILLGRIAGQFFKPRSAEIEVFIIHFTGFFLQRINDKTMVKSYKGDAINSHEIDKRFHDIRRLKTANECAINKYNFIKKMKSNFDRLFIAHEALHLEYEAHLTRNFGDKLYNVSCHFPWIGDRTRQLFLFAFLKFFLIKEKEVMLLTLTCSAQNLLELIRKLNPSNETGKVIVITRMSSSRTKTYLPSLVEAVRRSELNVLWQCDPVHGNTVSVNGVKTRIVEDIIEDIKSSFEVFARFDVALNGIHIEMTGEEVTECVGINVVESDLNLNYRTMCDPRLNLPQSLEVARVYAAEFVTLEKKRNQIK